MIELTQEQWQAIAQEENPTVIEPASKLARKEKPMFDRIISDPAILSGKPIIRGTRISVAMIIEWMASGATLADIVSRHPHLTVADVEQALAYVAEFARNEILLSVEVPG